LHRTRLFARRYNQAAMLAIEVARRSNARAEPMLLTRIRATPPQKNLSPEARRRNVVGAFAVRPSRARLVPGAHVVLVDDVLTTGATLSACARALKKAGARRVDALVLARVLKGGSALA
jgi:ComF family protein